MHNGSQRLVGLAIAGCWWVGSASATNAVVTSCTEGGFDTALAAANSGGGTITFSCSGTITFASYKVIQNGVAVTIDGGGTITFDGNNATTLMQVYASGQLTLTGLTLKRGANTIGATAVYNGNVLTLDDVQVQTNIGSASAVVNYGALVVRSSTFSGNSATGAATDGGAIQHVGTGLDVSGSTFNGNSAGRNGGAIFATAPFTVLNSTFNANTAAGGGGAIYQNGIGFDSPVTYATIVGNTAAFGGGLDSDTSGGATATITVGKSILGANNGGNCSGLGASSGYNLSSDTFCGGSFNFNVANGDVQSATLTMNALANNGGPTLTMLPAAGNPAINHVPLAQCAPNVDQRGGGRPFGAGCDSGAVEVSAVLDVIFYDGFE